MKYLKRLILIGCLFTVSSNPIFALERVDTLLEIKEFPNEREIICISLAIFESENASAKPAPVVFVEKEFHRRVRIRYSSTDDTFYALASRREFQLEPGGMYAIGSGSAQPARLVKIGNMAREHFDHMVEHGVTHYQVNRYLALNEEFLTFFEIVMETY